MTHKEQLQEQYEDALFALMMNELSIAEGKKALAELEMLEQEGTFEVPKQLHRRSLRTIAAAYRKETMQRAGRITTRTFRTVAVVALLSALLFTVAIAASPELRLTMLNTMVEVLDDRTRITFTGESTTTDDTPLITATWLPDGYTLQEDVPDEGFSYQIYSAPDRIDFSVIVDKASANASYSVDSEDATIEYMDIQGYDATILRKEDHVQIYWFMPERAFFVDIFSEGISDSDTIKFAKNLKIE